MGDVADMILDGTLCQSCGVFIGEGEGFPRECAYCRRAGKAAGKVACPVCKKKVKGLNDHIRDAHPGHTEREKATHETATRDMLDSARADLEMLREALGVPAEPHQSLIERMVEAAHIQRGAVPEGWELDESEAALLHHLTSPDDDGEHSPITLRAGAVRMDDGTVKFGLLCEYTDYPDEGAMYCAIQAFRRGEATADHFLDLCDTRDITAIAYNMQGRHVDGLRAVMDAAEIALLNIRDRHKDTGRFGASADELATLALLVDTYTNYWLAQSGDLYGRAREELRRARLRDKGGEKAA